MFFDNNGETDAVAMDQDAAARVILRLRGRHPKGTFEMFELTDSLTAKLVQIEELEERKVDCLKEFSIELVEFARGIA
jgi:hypothetical protein